MKCGILFLCHRSILVDIQCTEKMTLVIKKKAVSRTCSGKLKERPFLPRPPSSPFEGWSPKHQGFALRGQRRYSSPTGNGLRSPTTDFWSSQQQMGGFQRPWQSSTEQAQYPDSPQVTVSSGLRPTADPWPPAAVTSVTSSSHAQSPLATSGQGDTMTFLSGGIGMRQGGVM